jgi:hypothetical protein
MKVAYVTHNLGGGIDHHLFLQSSLQPENDYYKMQPGLHGVQVSIFDRQDRMFKISNEFHDSHGFASALDSFDQIQIHSLLGWEEVYLWVITNAPAVDFLSIFHDYSSFARNSHLLISPQGEWQPMVTRSLSEIEITLLDRSSEILAPSNDTALRIGRFLSRGVKKMNFLEEVNSRVYLEEKNSKARSRTEFTVVIPGHMALQKGACILKRCVDLKNLMKLPLNFTVLGKDLENRFQKNEVNFLGGYTQTSLNNILMKIKPDAFWWPTNGAETFSYTFSELMNSSLPKCVPNRGAFPERTNLVENVKIIDQPDLSLSQILSLVEVLNL